MQIIKILKVTLTILNECLQGHVIKKLIVKDIYCETWDTLSDTVNSFV